MSYSYATQHKIFYNFTLKNEYNGLKTHIETLINQEFWNPDNIQPGTLRFILPQQLIESEFENITLCTTNYDLIFERYFDSIKMDNILNTGILNGIFNPDNFNVNGKINYYKLHGSISWIIDDRDEIRFTPTSIDFKSKTTDGTKPLRYFINYPHIGDPDKEYHKKQLAMFDKFEASFKDSDLIIVIGTSMRDKKIKNIFEKFGKDKTIYYIGKKIDGFNDISNISIQHIKAHYPDKTVIERLRKIYLNFNKK